MNTLERPGTVCAQLDLGELSQILHDIEEDPDFFDVFGAFADLAQPKTTGLWFQIDGSDFEVAEWLLDDDELSPSPSSGGVAVHAQLRPLPVNEDRDTLPFGLCFQDASLTLSHNGTARREDQFMARPDGSLAALIEGQPVILDGQIIGRVNCNSNGLCKLQFNARCTIDCLDSLLSQLVCRSPTTPSTADSAIGWTFCCFYLGRLEEPEEHIFVGCTKQPLNAQRIPALNIERNQCSVPQIVA